MNTNNGSLMQLIVNNDVSNNSLNYLNMAVNYQTYDFNSNTNSNNINGNISLTFLRNVDKICPEYIVVNLFNSSENVDILFNYINNIYLLFRIGDIEIMKFPFSLLWNLNSPEIIGNTLYIHFPFDHFFGNIHLNTINYQNVTFTLKNFNNLANYASNCSLLCKTYMYGNSNQISYDMSNNIVQQISSLEINSGSLTQGQQIHLTDRFTINTNYFKGMVKGFFIESRNIDELQEIQFYINGHTRTNYDRFLIRTKCVKINENMLFYPFNFDISYHDRNYNSYQGALNFSRIDMSILRLKFNTIRNKVKIYALNMNIYEQRQVLGRLVYNIHNFHLVQDFTSHPLLSLGEIVSNRSQINSFDSHISSSTRNLFSTNASSSTSTYTNGYYPYGYTDPSGNTTTTHINDASGNPIIYSLDNSNLDLLITPITGRVTGNYINNELPQGSTIQQPIPEDKKICGISFEEIQENEFYMSCSTCSNNFKEQGIKIWLRQRRNCPTCRTNWVNYDIYLNV